VIDRIRIFLFRTEQISGKKMLPNSRRITNIWHRAVNIEKMSRIFLVFLGCKLQLIGMTYGQHKHLCMKHWKCQLKIYFLGIKLIRNVKFQNNHFFVFGKTFWKKLLDEFSADNFRTNTRPKTFSVDHFSGYLTTIQLGKYSRVKLPRACVMLKTFVSAWLKSQITFVLNLLEC
jgi:hypothetical protein